MCLEKSHCPFKHSPKLEQSSDIVKSGCFYLAKKNDTKYSDFVFTYSVYNIYIYMFILHTYIEMAMLPMVQPPPGGVDVNSVLL